MHKYVGVRANAAAARGSDERGLGSWEETGEGVVNKAALGPFVEHFLYKGLFSHALARTPK